MVKVRKDEEYRAARVRSGAGVQGEWELVVVKPEEGKSKQELNIYTVNRPSGVIEGGKFLVKDIIEVKLKASKKPDGTWGRTVTNVEAIIEPIDESEDFDIIGDVFGSGVSDGIDIDI